MNSTLTQYSHPPSSYVPDTLITSIFEYLPLSDYPNVSLTNKRFHQLTKESYTMWSKHSFSKFIDWSLEDQCKSESLVSPLRAKKCLYTEIIEPNQTIQAHFQIKSEWDKFFCSYLTMEQKETLLEEIFEVLRNPPAPFPRLKRDTMTFQTNSFFQNFLTEVYFRLNKKCLVKDQRHILLGQIVRQMCENPEESSLNEEEETEESEDPSKNLALISKHPNNAAKLYKLIYLMAQNHCQMVRGFLSSIEEPLVFLEQYTRLWKNFVLVTIDLDEVFTSLSDYINDLYNQENGCSSELDKFAIWRLLRKVWTNEVFSKVSSCLVEIINSLIFNLHQKKDKESKNDKREETIEVVQEVYHSIGDLSYDEYSIFFWECQPAPLNSPKGIIDSQILISINNNYHQIGLLKEKNEGLLTSIFKEDRKLIKVLFGKELSYNVTELQTVFLQNSLESVFNSALESVDNTQSAPETIENVYRPVGLNIYKVIDHLDLHKEELNQVYQRRDLQRKLGEAILKKCPLFGSYLDTLIKHQGKLKKQNKKFVEKKMGLFQRGFNNNDDENQNAFQFPRSFEIHAF